MSKRTRVRDYMRAHPKASTKTITNLFKVSTHTVYNIRWELKREAQIQQPALIADTKTPIRVPIFNLADSMELDLVNSPPHYTAGGIETIDFIQAKLTPEQYKGYLLGNILKYSSRIGLKGQEAQDAGKLNWYTKRLDASYQSDLNTK